MSSQLMLIPIHYYLAFFRWIHCSLLQSRLSRVTVWGRGVCPWGGGGVSEWRQFPCNECDIMHNSASVSVRVEEVCLSSVWRHGLWVMRLRC